MREKLIELLEQSLAYDGTGREMRFTGGDVVPVVESTILARSVVRCKDCTKTWCYLRQELGENGFCSAGERIENNGKDSVI